MNSYEEQFTKLGYSFGEAPAPGPMIDAVAIDGETVYASGQVPFEGKTLRGVGKVPSQVSLSEASECAALCALNVLRAVRHAVGSLDRIERVLRITGYVNADPNFTEAHLVINGASQLVMNVFGSAGRHARTALGLAQLPLGVCVEVEMILKLKSK